MYPSVEERLIGLQQRRIDAGKHLPADHPLQPPVIEAIQSIPTDDHTGTDSAKSMYHHLTLPLQHKQLQQQKHLNHQ